MLNLLPCSCLTLIYNSLETHNDNKANVNAGCDHLDKRISKLNFLIEQEKKAREQVESELKDFKVYYENLFSNNSQPMWIYDLETLKFLDVNEAAVMHYGYSKAEFRSMTLMDIRPKEDIERLHKDVEETRNTYNNAGVWRHIKKNGDTIFVEIVSHALIFNNRRARHVRINDITEKLAAENALKDNEAVLKLFIENAPASLAMFDKNMCYITCSKRWIGNFSLPYNNLAGMCHYDIFPEISSHWREIHRRAMNGEVLTNDVDEFVRASGKVHYVRWEVRPWTYSDGKIGGIVIFSEDITEKIHMEKETLDARNKAVMSDKLKSAFLANISHEIRTPLNGILGFSEILQSEELTNEEKNEYLQIIEACGNRMLSTINNIVNISIIDSGLIEVNYSQININELLDYLYKYFHLQASSKHIEFHVISELKKEEAVVKSDYDKVLAVLYNLIENSLKFTEKGSINVLCRKAGSIIEFTINDTGSGIMPEQKPYIFEKFRQGSERLSRNYEGSGVGLYLSKAYIDLLGGEISFESNPGHGTSFRFTIPAL